MNYTTWNPPVQLSIEEEMKTVQSLYEALQELNDTRRGQGKRYPLAFILCAMVLAKLAGQKTAAAERPNGFVIGPATWRSALHYAERRCRAR